MRCRRVFGLLGVAAAMGFAWAVGGGEAKRPPFEEARRLEEEGKREEAFRAYLAIPGAEYAAARLARPVAKDLLPLAERLLDAPPGVGARPRVLLVRADLLLATGDKAGALEGYRQAVRTIAKEPGQGWEAGLIPSNYYPVEPPHPDRRPYEAQPFREGCGSHRDNWLLRRFLALEAWDDAAREFERIWGLHRGFAAQGQFKGVGLQFALDYAYFLKQRGRIDASPGVLLDPFLRIDLDNNQSLMGEPYRGGWAVFGGLSRKEFIRLAYGAFKAAGKEDDLVAALTQRIEAGENRLRRVLARVRLHQGRVEDALTLEAAYIRAAGFDPLTSAYRLGVAYDDAGGKLAEAAAEFEKALALPYTPPKLPDKDEERVEEQAMMQMLPRELDLNSPAGRAWFHSDVLARLQRLYGALGQTDKVLALALRQFEADPARLESLESLEEAQRRFAAAGKGAAFADWARQTAPKAATPLGKANLHWLLKDYAPVAEALGAAAKAGGRPWDWAIRGWKERFARVGPDELKTLLVALVEANPKDGQAQLELLDLDNRLGSDDAVRALELLLEGKDPPPFGLTRPSAGLVALRNYFDLAYRLMRLYEKRGELGKLRALGLRAATGGKPFGWDLDHRWERYAGRDENGLPEDVAGCVALVVQHADEPTLAALEKAVAAMRDHPARGQVARRRAGGWKPSADRPIGWANLPQGAAVLACHENVLSLTHEAKHLYAGLPWGVAVYSHQGEPVTRVALGDAALDLAVLGEWLFVGTPTGLFRITIGSWEAAEVPLDASEVRADEVRPGTRRQPCVVALAADGPILWIGTFRSIQRLDTRSLALSLYTRDDLQVETGGDWRAFHLDADTVWAIGEHGTRRYDRKTDTWAKVACGERSVTLIADVKGQLWGSAYLNQELRQRPCLIDRKTLAVTPLLIEGLRQDDRAINETFAYLGTKDGQPVLGAGYRKFLFDPQSGKLRPLAVPEGKTAEFDSDLPPGLRGGNVWRKPDGTIVGTDGYTHRHEPLPGLRFWTPRWLLARLPDGTLALAGQRERSPRYQYPHEDWPDEYETWDEEAGLHLISPDGKTIRRISDAARSDVLPGDHVFGVVFPSAAPAWVCTSHGLAALDEKGSVLARVRRPDGLCANRVLGGAELGGRVYFATGWGDSGGGLAVYDPKTCVFTSLVRSDGLATDRLARIALDGDRLQLTYDTEYLRGGQMSGNYRLYPPGWLDPRTGQVASGGKASILGQSAVRRDRDARREPPRAMPCLGGHVLATVVGATHRVAQGEAVPRPYQAGQTQEMTWLCGTRGLIIVPRGAEPPVPAIRRIEPKLVPTLAETQRRAARSLRVDLASHDDIARALKDDNPYLRAQILANLAAARRDLAELLPLIAEQARHPQLRVRSSAVYLLTRAGPEAPVEATLRAFLGDPERYVRAVATIGLARRGQPPEAKFLRDVLEEDPHDGGIHFGNFPIGIDSTAGVLAGRERLYEALAPHATPEHFALFLEYPIPGHQSRLPILKALGQSLLRHPGAADILLKAYDAQRNTYTWGPVALAQAIFRQAGPAMLPKLHAALASPDRVVRSNAARACGALGDPSSIPPLIQALGLESGLARASIVWALGELKATAALPSLAKLYADAQNDEKRRAGSGFRSSQVQATIQAQYDSLSRIEAIGTEWNELKEAGLPKPVDPRAGEELLLPWHLLEAVRKIGPAASQAFYRALAGEKDAEGRREAALGLADARPDDREGNLAVLRQLLADPEARVRMVAAVSLLLLNQDSARQPILDWLRSGSPWEKGMTLQELARVRDPRQLDFALREIEAIAADLTLEDHVRRAASQLLGRLKRQ